MNEPPEQPKIPKREEQHAGAECAEAERLGRVAAHSKKSAADCPYAEGHAHREAWLKGLQTGNNRTRRRDMPPAEADGFTASMDGLHSHECPYPRGPENTEWHRGHDRGEEAKRKQQEEDYR